ncbi:hypothetical protein GCM10011586_26590 [Silvibacterium dinghuense]|nr:hypothetical protein GCM10011586_26590 [Silvibacterium dinghuense]
MYTNTFQRSVRITIDDSATRFERGTLYIAAEIAVSSENQIVLTMRLRSLEGE